VRSYSRAILVQVLRVVAAVVGAALALPAAACAYDWPVKPFGAQHAVRGSFDDPRQDLRKDGQPQYSFHSGIDVSAPDGSPVYAIERGFVSLRVGAVVVSGRHVFGYWHINPAVRNGTFVRRHQLVGRIEPGRGHVHLSESAGGVYLNPLRPGGIAPYADRTTPTIANLTLLSGGRPASIFGVSGTVDLVADAYDTPPLAPLGAWADARVTPAFMRWRITSPVAPVVAWRTAIDFRLHLLPSPLFSSVFAPGTLQNRPGNPGDYRFYLAHSFDTTRLRDGVYTLEVTASDTRGNATTAALPFRVANAVRR
jgi:hypothetical protein